MKALILLLFLIICMNTFAQSINEPDLEAIENAESPAEFNRAVMPKMTDRSKLKKTKALDEEILITQEDELTGIILEDYRVSGDSSRASFLYHFSSDLFEAGNLSNFEFNYASKYEFGWMEYFVSRATANFGEVAQYSSSALLNVSESSISDEAVSILSLGAGMSYRTHYFQEIINSTSWFETIGANLGYYQLSESVSNTKFGGFGVKADFGLHKRTSKNFHLGLKMSYNLASVKRSAKSESETSADRGITLRWISLGFDLGYYF